MIMLGWNSKLHTSALLILLGCLHFGVHALAVVDVEPMGVTFEQGATTYRVWAPNAQSVAVIGDFNGWRARQSDYLERDPRTGVWSVTIRGSRPRGAYQFLINDELRRRDPYGRMVSEDGTQSVFYDPDAFRWADVEPPRYALNELIIYEMHIGTFHDPRPNSGMPATFDDAIRRLDYLVELGVNTLCILPVHEFQGSQSWGYNPSDLFAVEQAYGGPDGFKRFVQACHQRGLAVHVDIVHNHYGPQNLDLLQFDGTGQRDRGGIYFFDGAGIDMTPWGPRVRFDQPMVRRFIRDNAIMWLKEYRVDGFRWDSTINIRAYNDGRYPIPEGAQMLVDINREIEERFPGRWSIAEDSLGIGNFHGSWDYDFHHQVMPSLSARTDIERNMRQISAALTRVPRMWRVIYVDNHDEAGKLNEERRIASDIDPADPGGDYARRLSGLGAVLTFTAPGIPLLFMGNEFQEYGTWHDDTPLDWSKTRRHAGTLALHRDLIALRRNSEGHSVGLKGRQIRVPAVDDDRKTIVYWRGHESHPADQVVVAMNFSGREEDLVIPFPSGGTWTLRMNTDWSTYGGERQHEARPFTLTSGTRAQTRMAPYSARIFSMVDRPGEVRTREVASEPASAPRATGPFSIWRTINLAGTFNEWSPTAWPFEHVADHVWEGKFFFDNIVDPKFKITANDYDAIWWGRPAGRVAAEESMHTPLRRLGPDFAARGTWNGLYLFRFNEREKTLEIERIGDDPLPEKPDEPVIEYRTWTDAQGATTSARLITVDGSMLQLEREDGRLIQVPVQAVSRADQNYVRQWIEENK